MFKVGAQLIIWGSRIFEDLPSVLDEVTELGYEGVETGGKVFSEYSEPERMLESRRLKLVGLHVPIVDLYREDSLEGYLEITGRLGGAYLTVSGVGHSSRLDMVSRDLEVLEEAGKKALDYNVKLCYHNHDWEFYTGVIGRIIREINDEYVGLCVDTYWVRSAGYDPAKFIERHLDRVEYLHLKDGTLEDMRSRRFRELGRGIVDFPNILEIAGGKVEWLVVEQDRTEGDPKESMKASLEYLKKVLSRIR